MAPRANWKGFLKVSELNCAVALFSASSDSDRIAFRTLNRRTGNHLNREFIDSDTQKLVLKEDQVKGYELEDSSYILLDAEEVAEAVPSSDKTLAVDAFIGLDEVEDVYLDKPYFLAPVNKESREVFDLIRDGLAANDVVAIAATVLFRRVRTLLIQPYEPCGLIAYTLNFNYEIRSASDAFKDVPELKLQPEMLSLAKHIIGTKMGKFDPNAFDDRYENALAELVKAKMEGRKITPLPEPEKGRVVDLMEALRRSAKAPAKGAGPTGKPTSKASKGTTAPSLKAG